MHNRSAISAAHHRVLERANNILYQRGEQTLPNSYPNSYSNLLTTNVGDITYSNSLTTNIAPPTNYPAPSYSIQNQPVPNYQLDNQNFNQNFNQSQAMQPYNKRTRRAAARAGVRNRPGVVPHPTKIARPQATTSGAISSRATTSRAITARATGTPVDSQMTVLANTPNNLNFNLASSVFDASFNSKNVLQVKMVNNLDGSVNFQILFQSASTEPHYPTRPQDYYYIPPYDLNSPIFKGMHYFQSTSM